MCILGVKKMVPWWWPLDVEISKGKYEGLKKYKLSHYIKSFSRIILMVKDSVKYYIFFMLLQFKNMIFIRYGVFKT